MTLADRLSDAVLHTLELSHVWLGAELGLYAALRELGPSTPAELAARAGIAERYAREWLEQQAVAAVLVAEDGRFSLPGEHAEVLLDPDSLLHRVPAAYNALDVVRALPLVREAFRSGAGVPASAYGEQGGNGAGDENRPEYLHHLAAEWLPALPDVHARLTAGARVADLGCGTGWSSIAIARGYPLTSVDGIDLDPVSIAQAQANAAGLGDRVTFRAGDAATLEGDYDLVCVLECLHDMADPVSVLRTAKSQVAADGVVLVMEERVAEEFTAPGDRVERAHYAWSAVMCLPASLVEQPSAAIGTCIRPSTVRALGLEAGFSAVELLPIEHDSWLFYRFTP
ncbi:class I SAM-dependent methyltransferase [Nonomuraea sp. NPDC050556]|uniref:class I SAM-dependent methyltransferase n=1 Tax=Nonomuraea sp. NPDC050556 TaxID=3364369 RepID=UPI0037AB8FEE